MEDYEIEAKDFIPVYGFIRYLNNNADKVGEGDLMRLQESVGVLIRSYILALYHSYAFQATVVTGAAIADSLENLL